MDSGGMGGWWGDGKKALRPRLHPKEVAFSTREPVQADGNMRRVRVAGWRTLLRCSLALKRFVGVMRTRHERWSASEGKKRARELALTCLNRGQRGNERGEASPDSSRSARPSDFRATHLHR